MVGDRMFCISNEERDKWNPALCLKCLKELPWLWENSTLLGVGIISWIWSGSPDSWRLLGCCGESSDHGLVSDGTGLAGRGLKGVTAPREERIWALSLLSQLKILCVHRNELHDELKRPIQLRIAAFTLLHKSLRFFWMVKSIIVSYLFF